MKRLIQYLRWQWLLFGHGTRKRRFFRRSMVQPFDSVNGTGVFEISQVWLAVWKPYRIFGHAPWGEAI